MGEYALLYILFAPFAGALALIFVSNRQPTLVRGIAASAAFVSLVASLYGSDAAALGAAALELADSHGRVHVVSPDVAALHTGHGNVMPQSLHGGPGRAGGGEEMGGIRGVKHYMQRTAVQGSPTMLSAITGEYVRGLRRPAWDDYTLA